MAWVGKIMRSYLFEVGRSGITLTVCAFALLPTLLTGYGIYTPVVCFYVFFFGAIEILLFCLVSSLIDHFAWKSAVYALVAGANVFIFNSVLRFDPTQYGSDRTNISGLLIIQLLFTFPIFYLLLRRDLPAHFWRIVPEIDE